MAGKRKLPEKDANPASSKGSATTTASDGGTPMENVLDDSVNRMKACMRVVWEKTAHQLAPPQWSYQLVI